MCIVGWRSYTSCFESFISSTSPSRGREKPKLNIPSGILEKAGFIPEDKVEIGVLDGEIRIVKADRIDDTEPRE